MTEALDGDVYDAPINEGADYVVQFKIKNGPLLRAMRARGYKSAAEFSRACGHINGSRVGDYLRLKRIPMTKKGYWHDTVLRMAEVLHMPPESLFPPEHIEVALKRSSGEFNVSAEEMEALVQTVNDPETDLLKRELYAKLYKVLDCLPPREWRVIAQRFGLVDGRVHTLDEIAKGLGVQRERIRQIENKAMRRITCNPAMRAEWKKVTDKKPVPPHTYDGHGYANRTDSSPRDPHYVPHWKREEEREREEREEAEREERAKAVRAERVAREQEAAREEAARRQAAQERERERLKADREASDAEFARRVAERKRLASEHFSKQEARTQAYKAAIRQAIEKPLQAFTGVIVPEDAIPAKPWKPQQ